MKRQYTEKVEQLLISVDALRGRQERFGNELVETHFQNSKRFTCLKFDGKKTKKLLKNSKVEVKEQIVVIFI